MLAWQRAVRISRQILARAFSAAGHALFVKVYVIGPLLHLGEVRNRVMTSQPRQSYMDVALDAARAAGTRGEVPVGAVLVAPDGEIAAFDGNRTREQHDPSAHAELLVIRAGCTAIQSQRLPGYDLYVTLEPCAMCAAAISYARIRRVYYAAHDPKSGAIESGPRFFDQPTCHHAPEVYAGIGEMEAKELLRAFFSARR